MNLPAFFRFSRKERIASFLLLVVLAALTALKKFHAPPIEEEKEESLRLVLFKRSIPPEDTVAFSSFSDEPSRTGDFYTSSGYRHYSSAGPGTVVSNRNKWDSNTSAGREVDSGSFETRRQEWKNYQRKEWQSVDLNSCDSTALEALPGIGAASARAIIRYRERLGGFRSVNQLSEIKALRSENLQTALPYLYADTSRLNRFCLNTCTAEEMRRHPYISYKVANSIAAMREQHGTYRRLADIKKSVLVNDSIYERICDYFSLCHPDD